MSLFQAAHIDHEMGGRGDVDGGDDRPDPTGVLRQGQDDQGDCPRFEVVAQHGPQGRASQATSFEYERSVQPLPRLGAWTATLDGMLMENALKPTRERLTVIRIFEALRELILWHQSN